MHRSERTALSEPPQVPPLVGVGQPIESRRDAAVMAPWVTRRFDARHGALDDLLRLAERRADEVARAQGQAAGVAAAEPGLGEPPGRQWRTTGRGAGGAGRNPSVRRVCPDRLWVLNCGTPDEAENS
jgi:hypothetical protein